MSTELEKIERKIIRLKAALCATGNMRPGKLSVQYRNPAERKTPFNQISVSVRRLTSQKNPAVSS